MGLKHRWKKFHSETLSDPRRLLPIDLAIIVLAVIALLTGGAQTTVRTTDQDKAASEALTDGGGIVDPEAGQTTIVDGGPGSGAAGPVTKSGRSAASSTGPGGPAVTATEIKVGIGYTTNPGSTNAAAGFQGIGQINQRRGWEAMIKEVDRNAPFGRKIVPVWYAISEEEAVSKGAEAVAGEQCQKWTRDNKVFMAYEGSGSDSLSACLTKAGVAQLGVGTGFSYDKTFSDYPYLVEHNSSALDRMAEDEVDQLVNFDYFAKCKVHVSTSPCVDGKPRIGLIRYNEPSHLAAAKRMKSALAKHGYALCEGCEFEVTYSNDDVAAQLDDATEVASAINNCKLPHKAMGAKSAGAPDGPCTHMLFLGSIAGVRITLFYVQQANDQQYQARLGFNRMDAPAAVRDFFVSNGQSQYLSQFTKSLLVSYAPGDFDIEPAAFKECVQLFKDAGETFTGSEASNKYAQIPFYCDTAWYHIAAFKAAGSSVTINTWLQGVANTGFVKSAGTFLMRTTATRRDGAGAVRVGDYDAGGACNCWKDVSGQIAV